MVARFFLFKANPYDLLLAAAAVVAIWQFVEDKLGKGKDRARKRRFLKPRWVIGVSLLVMLGAVTVRWSDVRLPVFLVLAAFIIWREFRPLRKAPVVADGPPYHPSHRIVDGQVQLIVSNLREQPNSATSVVREPADDLFRSLGQVPNLGSRFSPHFPLLTLWHPTEFMLSGKMVEGHTYEATWTLDVPSWGNQPLTLDPYTFVYRSKKRLTDE